VATQEQLLAALQGLTQQSTARSGSQPLQQVASTTRTSTPPAGTSKFPTLSSRMAGMQPVGDPKTQQAKFGLQSYAQQQSFNFPKLTDQINAAAQGKNRPSGALGAIAGLIDNPIAKAVLAPLVVLDTGRRGIISGVREVADILDTDDKTTASFGDWFNQTKDTSYGFGTAFPMKGNWGRAVGLIGDLALDPINWLTLGASIPKSLLLRGGLKAEGIASRAIIESAEELAALGPAYVERMVASEVAKEAARVAATKEGTSLRALIGKNITGRTSKTNLAALADRLGASPELVQTIAKDGRIAFAKSDEGLALAEKIGLKKTGLYIAGTQKRIPFTGPVAEALMTGLAGARGGIMGSRAMEWTVENFMPKGTSASRNMTELRRGLSTGKMYINGRLQKMDPQIAQWAVRLEGADQAARSLTNQMMDTYAKIVQPILDDADVTAVGPDFYKFLDTPESQWTRAMTPAEEKARIKLRAAFDQWKIDIESKYRLVDDNFRLKGIDNYLPHMMTDEAREWLGSLSSARAEDILKYLKVNMTDPTASFQARNLVENAEFFGVKLSKDDVEKGIDRLNQIARESDRGFTGQFFETDIGKILQKYGDHYASQYGTAEFMRIAKEGGMLAEAKAMGSVTKEWIKSLAEHAKALEAAVTTANKEMAIAGRNALEAIKTHLGSMTQEGGVVGKELKGLLDQAKVAGTPQEKLLALQNAKELMLRAFNNRTKAWMEFTDSIEGRTQVIDVLEKSIKDSQDAYEDLMNAVDTLVNGYKENYSRLGINLTDVPGETPVLVGKGGELLGIGDEIIGADGEVTTLAKFAKSLDKKMEAADVALKKSEENWNKVMQLHNVMNDILEGRVNVSSIGSSVYDEILDVINYQGVRAKRLVPMNGKNIRKVWGGRDLKLVSEDMRFIRNILDPDGTITGEKLARLTLDEVRERVARQAVSVNDLTELREAGVWLIVRDMMNDPELPALLRKGITEAGQEGATQTRFSNLVELLRQADATQKYLYGELGDEGVKRLGAATERLATLNSYLDTLNNSTDIRVSAKEIGFEGGVDEFVYFGDWNEETYNAAVKEVNKRIAKEQDGINKLQLKYNRHEASAPAIATSLNGVRDVMADLSAGVSEYYLHRETVHNFKRMMETLDAFGVAPTEKMYNAILSSVAKPELEAVLLFETESKALRQVFQDMSDRIQQFGLTKRELSPKDITRIEKELIDEIGGVPTRDQLQRAINSEMRSQDLSKANIFQEEIAKIFRAKAPAKGKPTAEVQALLDKQELLRKHFPEIEAVWSQSRTGTTSQLFYRHPEARSLEDAVIGELQKLSIFPDWGRPVARRARVADFTGVGVDKGLVRSGKSSASQYQELRGHIEKAINTLENSPRSDKGIVRELRSRYASILKNIDDERKLATEAASNLVGTKDQRAIKRRLTALAKSQDSDFGYVGMLKRALGGSEKAMSDFWGTIFGGEVYDFSATRGARQYRTITESDSFFGQMEARIVSRKRGLTTLIDERDLPTDILLDGKPGNFIDGKYVPGSWLLRKELRGAAALADAIEEHADDLLRAVGESKSYNSAERAAQRRLAKSEAATAVQGPELPSRAVARETAKNIVAQQQLDEIANTPLYTRALRRESEHSFAVELARLDEQTAVQLGFTPAEWNSLWDEPMRQTNIASLKSRRNSYIGQRKRLLNERGTLARTGKSTKLVDAKLEKLEPVLLELEEQVLQHEARGSALNKFAQLHDSWETLRTQNLSGLQVDEALSADEAMRKFANNSKTKTATPELKSRRASLKKSREASDEYQLLREYKKIEGGIETRLHDAFMQRRQNVLDQQEMLRAEISKLRGDKAAVDIRVKNLEDEIAKTLEVTTVTPKTKGVKLAQDVKRIAEELRTDTKAPVSNKATKQVRANLKRQLTTQLDREPTVAELNDVYAKFDESIRSVNEEYITLNKGDIKARQTPEQLRIAAEKRAVDAWKADTKAAGKGKLGDDGLIRREFVPTTQSEETMKLLNNLRFDLIVEQGRQQEVLGLLQDMSLERRSILAQQMKRMKELQEAMAVKERMLLPDSAGNRKIIKAKDAFAQASETRKAAQKAFDGAEEFAEWGPKAIEDARKTVVDVEKMAKDARYYLNKNEKFGIKNSGTLWLEDVDQYIDDAMYMMSQLNSNSIPDQIRMAVGQYVDARGAYMKKVSELSVAQQEAAFANGLKGLEFGSTLPPSLAGRVPDDAFNIVKTFDEGFVQLSKYFPDIGVRKEIAELFQNVHRLNEPQIVREFSKFMGKYTKFFKAYATLSPGFHIRNGMSNSFMLFAAGGDLRFLNEGLQMSKSWLDASKRGLTIERWIAEEVPTNLQQKARDAVDAFFGAGGGLSNDFFDKGLAPRGTKKSKEFGKWVENHSRFMLAWDGVSQGLDPNSASARVRKYLIDYTDISTADQVMRQIVPFWMWTSRNLPMQLGNMWLNPRAYAVYNSIKRNLDSSEEGDVVPGWMQEIGAFKLPFGNNLYATPDFGFNRVGQQVQELTDPRRTLANVNPLLRIPVELMGGRQFYSGRELSDKPVEVGNGAGAILQPFLAAAGFGETRDGKQFVDDRAYYALRNLVPFLGTAERLTPSIDTYQQRGYVNPLLGFLGVPGRQLKEQEIQSELARRKSNITKLTSREKALEQ
jgi:hypothetical protein